METAVAAEPAKAKVTTSIQTEAFAFAGSPEGVADATVFNKHWLKRVRSCLAVPARLVRY